MKEGINFFSSSYRGGQACSPLEVHPFSAPQPCLGLGRACSGDVDTSDSEEDATPKPTKMKKKKKKDKEEKKVKNAEGVEAESSSQLSSH